MMQIRLKKICQLAIYTVRRTQSFVSRFAPNNGTTDVMAVFKLPRPIYTVRDRNPPNMIHNKYYRRRILRLQRRILDTLSLPQVHTSSKSPSNPPRSSHEGRWSGFSVAMNLRTSFTVTNPERTPCSSTRIARGLFPAMSGSEIQAHKIDLPHALEYLHNDF